MGTWQLYVDETGQFGRVGDELGVGGWLVEGYASQTFSIELRSALARIFVGTPFPAHAAHHNHPASLLLMPLSRDGVEGFSARFRENVEAAFRRVRDGAGPIPQELRETVRTARHFGDVDPRLLGRVERWLERTDLFACRRLEQERDLQAQHFSSFLANELGPALSRRQTVVMAWKPTRTSDLASDPHGDADYGELFETMLERALAFVSERDEEAKLWIHVSKRMTTGNAAQQLRIASERAAGHPLLKRSRLPVRILDVRLLSYDLEAPAGFVVADFAINRVRRAIRSSLASWPDIAESIYGAAGVAAEEVCTLLTPPPLLPSICGSGADRVALRAVASAEAPPSLHALPRWTRQQANCWIQALREEVAQ